MAGLTGAGPRLVPEPGIEPGWTLWVRGILSSDLASALSDTIDPLRQESSHLTARPSPAHSAFRPMGFDGSGKVRAKHTRQQARVALSSDWIPYPLRLANPLKDRPRFSVFARALSWGIGQPLPSTIT